MVYRGWGLRPGILILALAVFAPAVVWAAGSSGSTGDADDRQEKAAHLVVMGDFNRDGIVDRAEAFAPVEGRAHGELVVSLGRADGTFQEPASRAELGAKPQTIAAGDFNRDGSPDVIVGDGGGDLVLFAGDGLGNLAVAGHIGRFQSVVSIAVADFNHDGIADVAVSDARASSVTVLLGVGDGSFHGGGSFPLRMMGTSPHVSVSDFNGDGFPDLAVVYDNEDGDTFDVLLGNGKGGFTSAPELGRVRDPNAHCVT